MAVNARTFQILYLVRQLAADEKAVTREAMSEIIASRRASAPDSYDKAYISPSAMQEMLNRMTTGDGLLTNGQGEYNFTVLGSQMADLLVGIDACSTLFIDAYKQQVCQAVLEQRQRLEQPAANPREVASLANISLDSARRGLADLFAADAVTEDRDGRSPLYAMPELAVEDDEPVEEENPIKAALASIEDDDLVPGDTELQPVVEDDDPENLVELPLGRILQDKTTEWSDVPVAEPVVDDADIEGVHVSGDMMMTGTETTVDWDVVPEETRWALYHLAEVAGLDLDDYLATVVKDHHARFQANVFCVKPVYAGRNSRLKQAEG